VKNGEANHVPTNRAPPMSDVKKERRIPLSTRKPVLFWFLVAGLPLIGVAVLLIICGMVPIWMHPDKIENAGAFGDSFGFTNAIISGLALVGVIIAVILQSQELKLTREEMKASVEAQQKSEAALAEQVRYQFLAAYLNGLSTVEGFFGRKADDELGDSSAQYRYLFRQAMATNSVIHLLDRMRQLLPKLASTIPINRSAILEAFIEIHKFVARSHTKIKATASPILGDRSLVILDVVRTLLEISQSVAHDKDLASVVEPLFGEITLTHVKIMESKDTDVADEALLEIIRILDRAISQISGLDPIPLE